ncbi:ABC transporter substrate-binding protein [Nesterenkonia alba]|uniref:ABC transporter substrate-binding protein n=1 Tax=Nesterenkonia alba TaxID=515814 RepID=UPI0012EB5EFE|nr:sugar ABC transporter substrate-binding protein [Nesterenkonia alba]
MTTATVQNPEAGVMEEIAEGFMEEHPDIEIEFLGTPMNELYSELTTMATGGNVPDVFTNTPEFFAQAADMGIVEPLDDLLDDDFIEALDPNLVEQARLDGSLQLVPHFSIPLALLYRADLFEEAGLEPPETWDEFKEVAEELTTDERYGFALVGSNDGSGGSRFLPIMRTFGAAELRQDGDTWVTEFDTDEAAKAFQLYKDLVDSGVVPPGPLQTSYSESMNYMANDTTAMTVTGSHSMGAIVDQNPDLEGTLAAVPLPIDGDNEPVSASGMLGMSVSSSSEYQEEAALWIEYVLNYESQVAWNEATGRLPARTDAAEDVVSDNPEFEGFLEAQQYVFTMPTVSYYERLQTIAAENYQAVIDGQKTAEEAAQDAADATQQLIDSNE